MTKIAPYTTHAEEIEPGIYVVNTRAIDGRWMQHEGPRDVAFFTERQAQKLAARVRLAGEVDERFWISGGTGYGTEEHEMALIEAEYWER